MRVLDYAAETFFLSPVIMFRQPTLSSMSNIFIMPFSQAVWMSCSFLCLTTIAAFGFQVFTNLERGLEKEMVHITWSDVVSYVLGAICQQSCYVTPSSLSARMTMFGIALTSLFLFTSYSANIVALLQSPSNAIRSISDLVSSPIEVGLQDLPYNRVFPKESTDPQTHQFYLQKVAPFGQKAFVNASEGMKRVRQGMYAFQVEKLAGYKEISEIYTEREKCGLKEMQLFSMAPLTFATRKHSGYREMFAQRLRWQREVGFLSRMARVWIPPRPVCENRMSDFVSVGIIEFYPALLVLQYGIAASIGMLLAELLYFHRHRFLKMVFLVKSSGNLELSNISTKKLDKNGPNLAWVK